MSDDTNKPRTIIGLTGPIGSGVSTVAALLGKKGFVSHRVSDLIRAEVESVTGKQFRELPEPRKTLQDHGNKMRQEKGRHYWVERILAAASGENDLLIESIRNKGEVDWLRDHCPRFFLIAVVASREKRWSRVKSQYNGQEGLFDRDDRRDSQEDDECGQQVEKCVGEADYVLLNETEIGYSVDRENVLAAKLDPNIKLLRGQEKRTPTPAEVHMATAYAQSHASLCLKRNVGAVIVDVDGIPLSLGFNENPVTMKPCVHEFKGCFKDQNMFQKLELMENVRCPACGEPLPKLATPWLCRCGEDLKARFFPSRNMEVCTALHAEERAIRSLHGRSAEGATMYVTTCPCFQCARYILEARIGRVVYVEAYPVKQSIDFLTSHGVKVEPFEGFKARAFNLIFKGVN